MTFRDRARCGIRLPTAGLAVLVLGAAVACSSQDGDALRAVSTDDPGLAGLPAEVVAERLSDPALQQVLNDEDPGSRTTMAQLNVASTVFCRQVLEEYQQWLYTGREPSVPGVVAPDVPAEGFDRFMADWVEMVQSAMDSGDPEALAAWLVAPGGCWITVADPSVPRVTVTDVVESAR